VPLAHHLLTHGLPTCSEGHHRYRTSDGYLGAGTSVDGGVTFHAPLYAEYDRSTPGERNALKNPRGPVTPRRFGERYLLLYFNRGAGGIEGSRNPYWLTAGAYDEERATIVWSQPEIVLYTTYAAGAAGQDPPGDKLGYP
jgi:hypothetical protein